MKATQDDNPSFRSSWRDLLSFSARLDGSDATGQPSILNNEEFVLIFPYPERLNTRVQSGRGSGDLNGRRANAHQTRGNVAVLLLPEDAVRESYKQSTCCWESRVLSSNENLSDFGDPIFSSFHPSLPLSCPSCEE